VRKAVLRDAVRERLPASTFRRAKHGFTVPLGPWLRGPLRDLAALAPASGLVEPAAARALRDAHAAGRRDTSSLLWALAALTLWKDTAWIR
jgi:asparagine synthase (glutamine-hydrolysing)